MVESANKFKIVGKEFLQFYGGITEQLPTPPLGLSYAVILVAHNGGQFDIPFLFSSFERCQIHQESTLLMMKYQLDTLHLVKNTLDIAPRNIPIPTNRQLATLYKYCTGNTMTMDNITAHQAAANVEATVCVLKLSLIHI